MFRSHTHLELGALNRPSRRPVHPEPRAPRIRLAAAIVALGGAGLLGCADKSPTGTSQAGTQVARDGVTGVLAADASAAKAQTSLTGGTIPLPIDQSINSADDAFGITQTGNGGGAGDFRIANPGNTGFAVFGFTTGSGAGVAGTAPAGSSGTGVKGFAFGSGEAGHFEIFNSGSPQAALFGQTIGSGTAVQGVSTGLGIGGRFENTSSANSKPALHVKTYGTGWTAAFIAGNSAAKGVTVQSSSSNVTLISENFGSGFAGKFIGYGSGKGVYIQTDGGAGLQVVGGSKNAVVHTPSGAKALYTEESTEVWFTDYGFGRLTNGRARILLDPSFAQTINPGEPYHVFVEPYGNAALFVVDRTPLGFVVRLKDGDPNSEFSYRIVAKRLGFEGNRLEPAPWADEAANRPGATR